MRAGTITRAQNFKVHERGSRPKHSTFVLCSSGCIGDRWGLLLRPEASRANGSGAVCKATVEVRKKRRVVRIMLKVLGVALVRSAKANETGGCPENSRRLGA